MIGPPTIQQLARDLWLADVCYAAACAQLGLLRAPRRAAVYVVYRSLECEEAGCVWLTVHKEATP